MFRSWRPGSWVLLGVCLTTAIVIVVMSQPHHPQPLYSTGLSYVGPNIEQGTRGPGQPVGPSKQIIPVDLEINEILQEFKLEVLPKQGAPYSFKIEVRVVRDELAEGGPVRSSRIPAPPERVPAWSSPATAPWRVGLNFRSP